MRREIERCQKGKGTGWEGNSLKEGRERETERLSKGAEVRPKRSKCNVKRWKERREEGKLKDAKREMYWV
jgi:hypothetical protein